MVKQKGARGVTNPADTRRSQPKQTLPNPPQEHPNSWGGLKPQRNPPGQIHEVFPHNSITLWVNAAKAGSYLGSRYETDVSSHRPTPAWGKMSSNHPPSIKGERTFTLPETPSLQFWYFSPKVTVTVSSCPQSFTRERCLRLDQSKNSTANLLRPGGKSFLLDSNHATQLLQQVYKPCNW